MDEDASHGGYATVKPGLNSTNAAPTGEESAITIPFTVSKDSRYYVYARVNGPTGDDDSIWLKVDDEDYKAAYGLNTVGWRWAKVASTDLAAGDHTLSLAYREDGLLVDKISITSFVYGPEELGEQEASNVCAPDF